MKTLYHYTSVGGFEGIIKNDSIRMTRSEFLNDPYDCHLFVKLVEKYLNSNRDLVKDTINSLSTCRREVEILYTQKGCELVPYIKYIQSNIGLYVMSLTEAQDAMNMWNYYGNGGMELEFTIEKLVNSLRKTLVSEREFLSKAKVIYANSELDIEKIEVPNFSEFILMNRDSGDVFGNHRSFIKSNSYYKADQLYDTCNLAMFIDTYLKGYIVSLEYLLKQGKITVETPVEKIYDMIFDNISNLNNYYYWKKDLSLYMLVLSTLIKSDTYRYEDEYRIVYFENTINQERRKKEEYGMKGIGANQFLYPFISFKDEQLLKDSLSQIIISPMTNNLPIDNSIYEKTIKKFLINCNFNPEINIKYSKHKIRL